MIDANMVKLSKEEAKLQIGGLMNQAATRGTNDFEIPRLMELMLEVEEGKIDPEKALEEAQTIVGSKQDYR